jgi:hypothetical protein
MPYVLMLLSLEQERAHCMPCSGAAFGRRADCPERVLAGLAAKSHEAGHLRSRYYTVVFRDLRDLARGLGVSWRSP